jgi:ornithine carbamoyltransferase
MMHFLTTSQHSPQDLIGIIRKAVVLKGNWPKFSQALAGKFLYLLFQKTSTRTSLSFAAGITQCGGNYLLQRWDDSNFSVGEIEDEIRYIATSAHACMARLRDNQDVVRLAQASPIPIINGCCNKYHPCQAMADMLTIFELFGGFEIKMLYIGARNNVFNSLACTFTRLGGTLYALTPIVNESSIDQSILAQGREPGRLIELEATHEQMSSAVKSVDVIYVDTWVDMEFFNEQSYQQEKQRRISTMMPFQLNEKTLADSKAVILHDMPMHAGFEITRPVMEANIATILQQADNRKYAQNAILLTLFEDQKIRKLFSEYGDPAAFQSQ